MSTQLLLRFDSFDQEAFDSDAENRAHAGLTLLQMWREGSATRWALLSVNDGEKARAWLDQAKALGHGPAEAHFLETA
ncbi:hypothetical protein [Salipiger mucosus]|uniref:Uncharacterized protein n=1 Tax=Salipiger mucosus DSM 16094 TaxID=1123237 RepID=S9SGU7_9RHOB|nr:hypothetical protein [Salipiger mucosus]EPX85504.1 hypothetical protein Salmuc_04775 [Salipiger mucosus DSM 16094]